MAKARGLRPSFSGQLIRGIPFKKQFISILQQKKRSYESRVCNGLIKYSHLGRNLTVICIRSKKLHTIIDRDWIIDHVFSLCGIRTDEEDYYIHDDEFVKEFRFSPKECAFTYGFRSGAKQEALQLKMTIDKNPPWRWEISFSQINVMERICSLSFAKCCDLINERLSLNICDDNGVCVYDIDHKFASNHGMVKTRAIILQPEKRKQKVAQFFFDFFSGLGFLGKRAFVYKEEIHEENLRKELLRTIFLGKVSWEEIELSYDLATTVILYIAKDLSCAELCLKNPKKEVGLDTYQIDCGITWIASRVALDAISPIS